MLGRVLVHEHVFLEAGVTEDDLTTMRVDTPRRCFERTGPR